MRCIILTGGSAGDLNKLHEIISVDDTIICADSGARIAAALDIVPHMVVGDFDSLSENEITNFAKKGIILKKYPPAKDDTDTALALAEALALKPGEIIIIGALGTRFDHSLANVHLLRTAFEKGIKARIIDEQNEISLVSPRETVVINGRPGDLFSLLPLTTEVTGVNVKGARWPLENATFTIGNPYGVSNRLAANRVEISITTGLMLLIKVMERK